MCDTMWEHFERPLPVCRDVLESVDGLSLLHITKSSLFSDGLSVMELFYLLRQKNLPALFENTNTSPLKKRMKLKIKWVNVQKKGGGVCYR